MELREYLLASLWGKIALFYCSFKGAHPYVFMLDNHCMRQINRLSRFSSKVHHHRRFGDNRIDRTGHPGISKYCLWAGPSAGYGARSCLLNARCCGGVGGLRYPSGCSELRVLCQGAACPDGPSRCQSSDICKYPGLGNYLREDITPSALD